MMCGRVIVLDGHAKSTGLCAMDCRQQVCSQKETTCAR